MECKGKIAGASVDVASGNALITFSTPFTSEIKDFINQSNEIGDLRIKAVKWHEKRGLKANAYFHVLCGLLATARTVDGDVVTPTQVKNEMLADYGQRELLDNGKPWVIKTQITLDQAMRLQNDTHLEFWRADPHEEGVYWYFIKRGSHTYDSREMSALINGTVEQCKRYKVETLPPDEIERMVRMWQAE